MKWSIVLGVLLLCFLANHLSGKQCIYYSYIIILGELWIYTLQTVLQGFQHLKTAVFYGKHFCIIGKKRLMFVR